MAGASHSKPWRRCARGLPPKLQRPRPLNGGNAPSAATASNVIVANRSKLRRQRYSGNGNAVVHFNSSRQMLERTLFTPGRRISFSIRKVDSDFRSRATTLMT
jgi:hypothetical protein